MARPRIHATPAARQAAYRVKHASRVIDPEQAATIDGLAQSLDRASSEVLHSLIRFALTNRNWKQLGLLPTRNQLSS